MPNTHGPVVAGGSEQFGLEGVRCDGLDVVRREQGLLNGSPPQIGECY